MLKSRSSCDFPDQVLLKQLSKMTGDCFVFKFLRSCVDGTEVFDTFSERKSVDGN